MDYIRICLWISISGSFAIIERNGLVPHRAEWKGENKCFQKILALIWVPQIPWYT